MRDKKASIVKGTTVSIVLGDITEQKVDAIVNAANSELAGGGGVDGAIHRAAGPTLAAACSELRKKHGICPPGNAVVTSAGNLSARIVVHAVGPRWRGGESGEQAILRAAYFNSLELSASASCSSVALPSISTGAYGFPIEEASRVALQACQDFALHDSRLSEIRLVLFSDADFDVYNGAFEDLMPDG